MMGPAVSVAAWSAGASPGAPSPGFGSTTREETVLAQTLGGVSLAASSGLCQQCGRNVPSGRLLQLPACAHSVCRQCFALCVSSSPVTAEAFEEAGGAAPSDQSFWCLRCGVSSRIPAGVRFVSTCSYQPSPLGARNSPTRSSMALASRRVMQELRLATAGGGADADSLGMRVSTHEGNLMHWRVSYAGDAVVLDVVFPPTYPARPPSIRVLAPRLPVTELVDTNSYVCLEALTRYEGGWEPGIRTGSLLVALGIQLSAMHAETSAMEAHKARGKMAFMCGRPPLRHAQLR